MQPPRALLGVGLALALTAGGCGPHVLGAKAPAFGSTTKLSTTADFLKGRWKMKVDSSTTSYKERSFGPLDLSEFIEFRSDHTCTEYGYGSDVHMTWKEASNGIDLTVVDVDGYDPATIKAGSAAEHEAYQNGHSRRFSRSAMSVRGGALGAATTRLELMPDKKRLFNPASMNSDGSSRMGIVTFERVE